MIRTCLALGAAALAIAVPSSAQDLENPQSSFTDNLPPQVWIAKVERTERGHRIGKPEAEAALIEFISYTCSHCADFVKQGGPTLDLVAVGPGELSVEVRPIIRNGLDLAISMMVQCGDISGFKDRHRMFLYTQDQWLEKAINAPKTQQAAWMRADVAGRLSLASALDFDDMLAQRGLRPSEITACLSDETKAQAILANDKADREEFGVTGTPTFALDGETLENVHDWAALSAVLQARFRPQPAPDTLPTSTPD